MILSGKEVVNKIYGELEDKIAVEGLEPELAIISVGEDPASEVYIKNKLKSAEKLEIKTTHCQLGEDTTEKNLLELIERLNKNKDIDGFIVQLPVPKHINPNKLIEAIDPKKDVDGFHPFNMGKIFQGIINEKSMIPATPFGIMKMIEHYNIELDG